MAQKTRIKRVSRGTKPKTDRSYALVFELAAVYIKYVSHRPTRISPNRSKHRLAAKHGERRDHTPRGSLIQSQAAEFVRVAAEPILGHYDNLDDQIKEAVRKHKS